MSSGHLGPLLFVGWRDLQGQQVSEGITAANYWESSAPANPLAPGNARAWRPQLWNTDASWNGKSGSFGLFSCPFDAL
jgi:hypothetical protein